jgi:wyosine [tRNA(Phe)-imidazoG37] synthetase (radical SAM superfamily)
LFLFQVTNAQFPDAMRKLKSCCQLYVSIDASNAVSRARPGPLLLARDV